MNFTLSRFGSIPEVGTPGFFNIDSQEFPTIEREWLDNAPFVSCVPLGRYRIVHYSSRKYPEAYALVNEDLGVYLNKEDMHTDSSGRYSILIHSANLASELAGCIAPGIDRGFLNIKGKTGLGVFQSRTAIEAIYTILSNNDHVFLDILEVKPSW